MRLSVLLTGFGPFPGARFNPTATLPGRLAARRRPALADVKRVAHIFRTSYAAVDRDLPALLKKIRPDVVLMFGAATRTDYLRIETRARNARSLLFSDVDGRRLARGAIAIGAPTTRPGRAPHQALLAAVHAKRVPARLSHSAGRYLCNFIYWRALEAAHGNGTQVVQFIHVPLVRHKPGSRRRRLTDADLARAGEAILLTLVAAARTRKREGETALAYGVSAAVPLELQPGRKCRQRQAVAG
jgi:pyroglutamyl-peptidase